jgi:hypothetical protein
MICKERNALWGLLVLFCLFADRVAAQTATVSVATDADSFVRSFAPTSNYGAAGALSVSGAAAVNALGAQNGLFDTLIRFPASNVVAFLDGALGAQDWIITEARLAVTEMAVPDNAIFNRGVGAFEIRWIASDGWIEGTGTPKTPTSDGVTWQDLPAILNSNLDESLAVFTNSGADGQITFSLALTGRFIDALRQGEELCLYLTARSPQVGFTFNSRNFGNTNAQPMLAVRAAANPRPRLDCISFAATNVSVCFVTASNWMSVLQSSDGVSSGWSNVLTVSAQPTNGHVVFVDGVANQERFYRLSLSQP